MTPPQASPEGRLRLLIPLAVAVALFMENLDSTIIATALPSIARSLGTTSIKLSMAVSVYLLSLAVFIPLSGWLADRFGTRAIFAGAIGLFTASSALCGVSESLAMLVCARALQGVAGAMMMPVGRLILNRNFAKRDLVAAMSYVTIPALIGPMIGPLIGGAITTYASWRWIFFINLPIGVVGIFFVLWAIRDGELPDRRPLDWIGCLLVGLGLAGLVLGIETAGRGLLPEGAEWALLAVSAASFALYVWHARRVRAPALDLALFRIPTFRASVVGGTLCRMGYGATPFLLPLLLQLGLGRTPLESGAITFTGAIGAMMMKMTVTPILRRFGFRRLLTVNAFITGGLTMGLALFAGGMSPVLMVAILLVYGFLRSLQFTCLGAIVYADLGPSQLSSGTSIASVGQQVSMSLGVAVGAGLLHLVTASMGTASPELGAFVPTLVLVGLFPISSFLIFRRLAPDAGAEMSGHREPERAALADGAAVEARIGP